MDLLFEQAHWENDVIVIGVDEVGRGCIAGPVVAGAVCFAVNHNLIEGVNDSKLLTAKRRKVLADIIRMKALGYGIGQVSNTYVDKYGIVPAVTEAMKQACLSLLHLHAQLLICIDGPVTLGLEQLGLPIKTIVHGDRLVYSIAAASIVAKEYRDGLMVEYHSQYTGYNWGHNMGYGTKAHYEAIKNLGLCPLHRRSFIHYTPS